MTCGCDIPGSHGTAIPVPWTRFFAVGPFVDLGDNPVVAWRALGWVSDFPPPAASGYVFVKQGTPARTSDPLSVVRKVAAAAAAEMQESILIGEAVSFVGSRVLYRGVEVLEPVPIPRLIAEAIEAADDVLARVFKAKVILDPSKPAGRRILIRQTADAMVATARPWEVRAETAARKFLRQNWPDLPKSEVNKLITQASARIKEVPVRSVKGINKVISVEQNRVMEGARKAAIQRHNLNIGASLTSPDRKAIEASQRTSVRWLTNEYGARAKQFEDKAGAIVGRGLAEGLGREEISRDLLTEFHRSVSGRTASYFDVYAGALVDRARTRSEMNSYRDAEITRWIASAVMDEVTTDFCRWVDGRVFDVDTSISVMDLADQAGLSVAEMKSANPWVRMGTVGGERVATAGGTPIFSVAQSGLGTQAAGSYNNKAGADNIAALGLGGPPYHGRCRTTSVADVQITSIPTVPRPPPAPKPKPKPAKPTRPARPTKPTPTKPTPAPRPTAPPPQPTPAAPQPTAPANIKPEVKLPAHYMRDRAIAGGKWDLDALKEQVLKIDDAIAAGKEISKKQQLELRKMINALCADNGMISQDVAKRGLGRQLFEIDKTGTGFVGWHDWQGRLALTEKRWKELVRWSVNPKSDASALRTLIHETVHGHSPIKPVVYEGLGKKVEEATTELAARGIMRQIGVTNFRGSYTGWCDAVVKTVQDSIEHGIKVSSGSVRTDAALREILRGKNVARDLAERASIAMRRVVKRFGSGNTFAKHFAESVEWPAELFAGLSEKEAEALRKKLVTHLHKMIKKNLENAPMWS